MSYSIDLYRGSMKPAKSFKDFLFYVSFFPQLVAGPIVRAADFIPQISEPFKFDKSKFDKALLLIIGGLFKKAIIADYISINFVDRIFSNPNLYTPFENLMAVYGYALQIYCDFSGYSDMAIGLALLMGFSLPDNFNKPYRAVSITDFWRRWHISLSSWLRDYLYISLGGNRKGNIRTYFNLMMTMLLGGLWHGASWKFVLWGFGHGTALVIEKALFKNPSKPSKYKILRFLGWFITFHFVIFLWIYFRASSFHNALEILSNIALFQWDDLSTIPTIISAYSIVFSLFFIGYALHWMPISLHESINNLFTKLPLFMKAFILGVLFWMVYLIANAAVQPFIYFQF